MLIWVCDLIVATTETTFSDPVVAFGVNRVDILPILGNLARAKQRTAVYGWAHDRSRSSVVWHGESRCCDEELSEFTDQLAARIAQRPSMGLRLAKQSVNQTQDAQGFYSALQAAMSLQQLATRIMKSFMAELLTQQGLWLSSAGKITLELSTQPRRKVALGR